MAATGEVMRAPPARAGGLPYAPLQLRVVAFILDCIVVLSFAMIFFAVGGIQVILQGDDPPDTAVYVWIAITGLCFFPFTPLFFATLWWWRCQSPGMMAVSIGVADREGYRLTFARSLLRALLWPFTMLPLGIGALTILFDQESRALHDLLAGTVVLDLP
jgi:uncharacterized RDD family membrane protein YckC